ncbi:unnamed protein product [Protopolystoma xenopodis]|uniref:Uncharacterized protein n=1 Tax=Protopolystoma xenopodis TaxID=117903 RepID=A0A448WP45_9PLAT|nr:unnamed protein product [Protopolystoma xenopodis]
MIILLTLVTAGAITTFCLSSQMSLVYLPSTTPTIYTGRTTAVSLQIISHFIDRLLPSLLLSLTLILLVPESLWMVSRLPSAGALVTKEVQKTQNLAIGM